jgi:hypothetical protein
MYICTNFIWFISCGLDHQGSIPDGQRFFPPYHGIQLGSGAYPASSAMDKSKVVLVLFFKPSTTP